jgi:hypothetical protein
MNRKDRRSLNVKDPNGVRLEPLLLLVETRDHLGRPLQTRVCYDEETIGNVVGNRVVGNRSSPDATMLLLWGPPQPRQS